jgi:hypothetical protein
VSSKSAHRGDRWPTCTALRSFDAHPCAAFVRNDEKIGETGFEPATARPPAGCATRLRHSPWSSRFYEHIRSRGLVPSGHMRTYVRVGTRLGGDTRRDRQGRGSLCELSSSANRPPWWVRTRGGSSTVEPRPSKAMTRVRVPSAASPATTARGRASLPSQLPDNLRPCASGPCLRCSP